MGIRTIDTLVMIIADRNGGKSNQLRSIFEEFEFYHFYSGYPRSSNLRRKYHVHPDIDVFLRLASWHEKGESYADVERDIETGYNNINRRYKVLVPAQVTQRKAFLAVKIYSLSLLWTLIFVEHLQFGLIQTYQNGDNSEFLLVWRRLCLHVVTSVPSQSIA